MIRKILKLFLALLAVLLVLVGYGLYVTFGQNAPPTDGEMAGRGRSVLDSHVLSYVLYAGNGELVLIDAGRDPEARLLKAEIARRELKPEAVKAILLTHGHPDHVAGVGQFPNAKVYALAQELPFASGQRKYLSPVQRVFPHGNAKTAVTQPLQDGDVLELGELRIRVFHVPGHTAGSAAYLVDGVLYLGDSAVGRRDGTLGPAPWFFTDDTARNQKSLAQLAGRFAPDDVKSLAFAHSGPLQGLQPLKDFAAAQANEPK